MGETAGGAGDRFDRAARWAKEIGDRWRGVLDLWRRGVAEAVEVGMALRRIHPIHGEPGEDRLDWGE